MKHQWKLDENGKPDEWAWESGFHNGVYCERCGKAVCIYCNPDWELMDDCIEPPKQKPKTNADRIRAMTDEELAVLLADEIPHGDCYGCDLECSSAEGDKFMDCCHNAFYKWLKQPAEGE